MKFNVLTQKNIINFNRQLTDNDPWYITDKTERNAIGHMAIVEF